MRARWYKVFNDLLGNKTRTVLIVLSIAVGLIAVGTIISARTILSEEMQRSFNSITPSNGTVRTLEVFGQDFLLAVRRMDGVVDAEARRLIDCRIKTSPDEWSNITLFVVDDYEKLRVNKIKPVAGAWPPPEREILIERAALPLIKARVGDEMLIELPNEKRRTLRIAGTVHDMAQMPAQFDNTPYGYISMDTLKWLGEAYGFNELDILTEGADDKRTVLNVVNEVKNRAEKSGLTIPLSMTAEPGQIPLDDVLDAILLLMGILGVLALLMSAFLIVNTITALLAQQRHQIGVMKAIGGSMKQLMGMYLAMVCAYGLAALIISIPASILASRGLSRFLAAQFNFDLIQMPIPFLSIAIQAVIGLLVPVAASIYPFVSSLNISASEAMSAFSIGRGMQGKDPIDRLISGKNLWFARFYLVRPVLLALRNLFRSKRRLALTLTTLVLAGAVFVSVFSVQSSLDATMKDFMKWYNFDIMVNFRQSYRTDEVARVAGRVAGVKFTDFWGLEMLRVVRPDGTESAASYLFAPRINSPYAPSPTILEGRWLLPEDENALIISTILGRDEKINLGDDVVVKIAGQEQTMRVVGVSIGIGESLVYASFDFVSRLTGNADQASTALVTVDPGSRGDQNRIVDDLDRAFKLAGMRTASVYTIEREMKEAMEMFSVVTNLLLVMAIMLAIVGGLGLMGTMSINVLERTREIGVLRAIGASNRNVANVFILEGLAVGFISWILGGLLAYPMGRAISAAAGTPLIGAELTYAYSMSGLWTWLVLVLVLSALASFIPARNASRLTVREVLNYE